MIKPPTPWPPVTVEPRDGSQLLAQKKWTHISVRIDDSTIKDIDTLKRLYPTKTQADIFRYALKYLLKEKHGPERT